MCLILLAWQTDPRYPLVVAANRDEFFNRPTTSASFWPEASDVLAGKDDEAGGTWMGVTRASRFAALTNFRDPQQMHTGRPSRGKLVVDFLISNESPASYTERSQAFGSQCNGYNLLVGDRDSLWWSSNVTGESRALAPGIYGLSNHLLDTPWPKVRVGKTALDSALTALPDNQQLMDLLLDQTIHQDRDLPNTGIALDWERLLSAAFIRIPPVAPSYGTLSSTVMMMKHDGMTSFDEITWGKQGNPANISSRNRYVFQRR